MSETRPYYLNCRVGEEWYGIPLAAIIEVVHLVDLSELPGTAPDVLGLLAMRDMVMPVIDLRVRFGLADRDLRLDTPIVAVRTPHGLVGLVVDDADDIDQLDASQINDYDGTASPYIAGVARLPERLLLLLNIDLLDTHDH